MLLDQRTYTCRPGTLPLHLTLYKEFGNAVQTRHLGLPLVIMSAETGDLNTYVHIWMYKDAADRATRRAAMAADPEWQVYLKKSGEAGYIIGQKNSLMLAADFETRKLG